MKNIDIIIPVYNEGSKLESNLRAIWSYASKVSGICWRMIIVDDGSTDETHSLLKAYCNSNNDAQMVCLTRNFGKEAAILAGLEHSSADAVIVMDSDLQHPPELIPQMVGIWLQSVEVIEACKSSRGNETVLKKKLAQCFYSTFRMLAGRDLANHSDFKLLDKKVVQAYLKLPERKRFFRGLIPWMGFSSAKVYFDVPDRSHGASGWSLIKLFRFSIDALSGFTAAPLYFIIFLGMICFVLSLVIGGTALYFKFTGLAVSGFTTVILLILLIGSFIMFGLGLIGVYLGQIFDEVKRRPVFMVDNEKSILQDKE